MMWKKANDLAADKWEKRCLKAEKELEKLRAFWERSRLADKMTFEQYEWKTTETTGGEDE